MTRPRGVTLIELLVVLTMLGIMAGIVGLNWRPGRWQPTGDTTSPIAALRRRAAQLGRAVTDTAALRGITVRVIAFPDGRIVGAARLGVNPLTGESTDAAH